MKNPRNLKQAIENDFLITNISSKGSVKCRVNVKRRFHKADCKDFFSFWVTSAHVSRNYPLAYERN